MNQNLSTNNAVFDPPVGITNPPIDELLDLRVLGRIGLLLILVDVSLVDLPHVAHVGVVERRAVQLLEMVYTALLLLGGRGGQRHAVLFGKLLLLLVIGLVILDGHVRILANLLVRRLLRREL